MTKQNKKEKNKENYLKKQRHRKQLISRGIHIQSQGFTMRKKNKKDKENTINTAYPPKNADRQLNKINENSDVNNIRRFYTNAGQLRNKLKEFERRIE